MNSVSLRSSSSQINLIKEQLLQNSIKLLSIAELTAEELTFLLQPLKRNSSLTRIEFYSFGVGGDNEGNFVFQDLLDAIATKTSLLALQVTSRVNKMNSLDDTWYSARISQENVASLSKLLQTSLRGVTSLNLSFNRLMSPSYSIDIADVLANSDRLTSLNFNYNLIADDGLKILARSLKQNRSLRELGLSGCKNRAQAQQQSSSSTSDSSWSDSDSGVVALAEALRDHQSLLKLKLRENEIGVQGSLAIAYLLMSSDKLQSLDVGLNNFGKFVYSQSISMALAMSTSLTFLDLSQNSIGNDGAVAIVTGVVANSSIIELNLATNSIEAAGLFSFARVFDSNTTLLTLNLSGNMLQVEPVSLPMEVFFAALGSNSTLQSLNLSHLMLREHCGDAIARVLANNDSLTHFDLQSNYLSRSNALSIAESLTSNYAMKWLLLENNSTGVETMLSIQALCSRNSRICWITVHPQLIQFVLAMFPLQLPPYVLLEIFDWLPMMNRISHLKKINLIYSVQHSIRRVKNLE